MASECLVKCSVTDSQFNGAVCRPCNMLALQLLCCYSHFCSPHVQRPLLTSTQHSFTAQVHQPWRTWSITCGHLNMSQAHMPHTGSRMHAFTTAYMSSTCGCGECTGNIRMYRGMASHGTHQQSFTIQMDMSHHPQGHTAFSNTTSATGIASLNSGMNMILLVA